MDEPSGAFWVFFFFWISFVYFFILEFHFLFFIRFDLTQVLCFLFIIEEVSSNDDAFPTYIHTWDGASCRQNLLLTLNYYLLPILLIGMAILDTLLTHLISK
jgi:hypothetical protein